MMNITFRKAAADDIDRISEIYEMIHTEQERGMTYTGWVRGVYPVRDTAESALGRGDLFVEELDGDIAGAAIINHTQGDVYANAPWNFDAPDARVMVLHTLVIDPGIKGKGLGRAFVEFYEQYAREHGCDILRLDTNVLNRNARAFYKKMNYSEVAVLPCEFNGISNVDLVMLEKKL